MASAQGRQRPAMSPTCSQAHSFCGRFFKQQRGTLRRSAESQHDSRRQPRASEALSASTRGGNGVAPRSTDVENVIIIGSGPAGYTAAIYAARANLRPLVYEGVQQGGVRGGQLMTTTEVENFPGFPSGISGPDLMDRMRQQAERWGARLVTQDVEALDLQQRPFVVRGEEGAAARAHAVIVATGATAKRLGLPSEQQFWSVGISACAICDGASPLFKGQEVAVVGGGDTAAEEALYLTKYASRVHLLVRSGAMRASKAMVDRVLAHPRVQVHLHTAVGDAFGGQTLQGLHLVDTQTGEGRDLAVRGLFYGIGHKPNSELLEGQVALGEGGYVQVEGGCRTSLEGVFSAGDLHDTEWRQAITAAGSGCMAALAAERYLASNGLLQEFHQEPPEPPATEQQAAAAAGAPSTNGQLSLEEEFNIFADRHKGQYALRKLYHESDRLLAVLYTAPTCGPCRTLKPILSKLLEEYPGKVHYVEIDVEQDPEVAEAAGVSGTPTVQLFKHKERLAVLPGVRMRADYRKAIAPHLD